MYSFFAIVLSNELSTYFSFVRVRTDITDLIELSSQEEVHYCLKYTLYILSGEGLLYFFLMFTILSLMVLKDHKLLRDHKIIISSNYKF